MGIKKIARPINSAKNKFIQWLKDNNAENIDEYEGKKKDGDGWDYYRTVSAFVGETLYTVYFTIWNGTVKIDYSDEENRYDDMSVEDFMQLLW